MQTQTLNFTRNYMFMQILLTLMLVILYRDVEIIPEKAMK